MFIKFNSKLEQKRGMKYRDPIEDTTFATVVEDEYNEWITGVVLDGGEQQLWKMNIKGTVFPDVLILKAQLLEQRMLLLS